MARQDVVGARELKTRLGRYLRRVREGRTLVITDRGEPVAELRRIDRDADPLAAKLATLHASGAVTWNKRGPLPPFQPIRTRGRLVSDAVIEDREDRF